MFMYLYTIDELEDDEATLTASGDKEELTPHVGHYRPAIDLTRFQKLIEVEESAPEIEDEQKRGRVSSRYAAHGGGSGHQQTGGSSSGRIDDSGTAGVRCGKG